VQGIKRLGSGPVMRALIEQDNGWLRWLRQGSVTLAAVFVIGIGIADEAVSDAPTRHESDLRQFAYKIGIGKIAKYPEMFVPRLDVGPLGGCKRNHIILVKEPDASFRGQSSIHTPFALIDGLFRQRGGYQPIETQLLKLHVSSAVVSEQDQWPEKVWWHPGWNGINSGNWVDRVWISDELHSGDDGNWRFQSNCRVRLAQSGIRGGSSDEPQQDRRPSENDSENRSYPMRVTNYFEYAGKTFRKEYVERGAFMVFGIIGAVLIGVYYARKLRK
jgi:hypothetical protein